MVLFSTDAYTLGDAYEYLMGQFAADSGKKPGEFYMPQQISSILSGIVTLDSQDPATGKKKRLESVFDFACGSGPLLLNVRHRMKESKGRIGKIFGMEKNVTTDNLARMNILLHGVKDSEFDIYRGQRSTIEFRLAMVLGHRRGKLAVVVCFCAARAMNGSTSLTTDTQH